MVETASGTACGETSPLTPCLELHGAFDARAARTALETLRGYAGTEPVVVDFSKVSFFQDFALDLFARELSLCPQIRLRTRGLPGHPARVLQYLRIDPRTLTPLRMSRLVPAVHRAWNDRDLDD